MASKNTDYVNAQFDDAELRIKKLYEKIKDYQEYDDHPIACNHCDLNWGWFGDSYIERIYIWREKSRIYMVASIIMWSSRTGWGFQTYPISCKSWGMPRQTYSMSDGTASMTLTPTSSGIVLNGQRGSSGNPCFVIETSWDA